MATFQAPETASTNSAGRPGDVVRGALGRYLTDLDEQPLAARTRQAYASHVTAYATWLAEQAGGGALALREPRTRDLAGRDFKRQLKERGWKPSSVNLALAAVDHFNRFLGLGPANVRREEQPQAAPRALARDEQRALLRAAEEASPRDAAIVTLLLYSALRLNELAALDLRDVKLSARKGMVVVRAGKGDAYRQVPLNRPARAALDAWIAVRRDIAGDDEAALLLNRTGRRLSARAIDMAIRKVATAAGVTLSAHVLRHTCVTNLVRGGHDLVLVAELAGHRRLETTRRYSLPSEADRQAAMDSIEIQDA